MQAGSDLGIGRMEQGLRVPLCTALGWWQGFQGPEAVLSWGVPGDLKSAPGPGYMS